MGTDVVLSICIPTYNRVKFLTEALESIVNQLSAASPVEICISDNASNDGTTEFIEKFRKDRPDVRLRYNKNEKNYGPDRNYILCLKMATGSYVWMLGSDDTLVDGCIDSILSIVSSNQNCGLFLFNRIDCDFYMKPKYKRYWLDEGIESQTFDFTDKYQEGFYFAHANDAGALFSFISAFVAKREMLTLFDFDESYIGTAYSYLFYVYSYIKSGTKIRYIKDHFVYCRLDNSTFNINVPHRLRIDFKGFIKVSNDFYKDDINRFPFLFIIKKTHAFTKILSLHLSATDQEWHNEFVPWLKECGWLERELKGIEKIGNSFVKSIFKLQKGIKFSIRKLSSVKE